MRTFYFIILSKAIVPDRSLVCLKSLDHLPTVHFFPVETALNILLGPLQLRQGLLTHLKVAFHLSPLFVQVQLLVLLSLVGSLYLVNGLLQLGLHFHQMVILLL